MIAQEAEVIINTDLKQIFPKATISSQKIQSQYCPEMIDADNTYKIYALKNEQKIEGYYFIESCVLLDRFAQIRTVQAMTARIRDFFSSSNENFFSVQYQFKDETEFKCYVYVEK